MPQNGKWHEPGAMGIRRYMRDAMANYRDYAPPGAISLRFSRDSAPAWLWHEEGLRGAALALAAADC